jgi:hypothetical protein
MRSWSVIRQNSPPSDAVTNRVPSRHDLGDGSWVHA